MVAVKTHEADRFIATRAKHIYLYLVHGLDAGLISERARLIARTWTPDPLQITRLAGDDIAADPLLLIDEANSIGLFGGQRVIWISTGGKNFAGAIESLVAAPPSECVVIIEAGSLKKDSPLRRIAERLREAAAIECYPDRAEDIERLIDTEVKAAGLSIEPEAKHALVQLLGGDRLTTRAELSKLILYAHGRGTITRKDVDSLIADASALAMDDAVNGAFDGDYVTVEETARRFFATGGDGSVLLGAAVRPEPAPDVPGCGKWGKSRRPSREIRSLWRRSGACSTDKALEFGADGSCRFHSRRRRSENAPRARSRRTDRYSGPLVRRPGGAPETLTVQAATKSVELFKRLVADTDLAGFTLVDDFD